LDKDIQKILLQQLFIKNIFLIFDFMRREIFEKLLQIMLPGSEITHYELLLRNQLNENNEWIPDSPAVFVVIKYNPDTNNDIRSGRLSQRLSDMTGYEVNIDEGLSMEIYNNKIKVN
jgi:hypothetical protein